MTIKQKQCLLTYLGYYTGSIDGLWGEKSRAATESFQRDYLLTVDGAFGDGTAQKIREVVASGELPTDTPEDPAEPAGGTGTYWDGIKHFKRSEFRCPCPRCGGFPVEPEERLVKLADRVREHFGAPVIVTSGVRCQAHNDELKGSAPNSYHVRGKAMDFVVSGFSAQIVLAYARTLGVHYAYAIDENAVHMDVN